MQVKTYARSARYGMAGPKQSQIWDKLPSWGLGLLLDRGQKFRRIRGQYRNPARGKQCDDIHGGAKFCAARNSVSIHKLTRENLPPHFT
jgi:hypothetical protein